MPWDSRQFWFALITRSLTRRERGSRRQRGLAEFPCAATMPIIAAPFPVNENEGVKKSREVKALPPGIVAALATYRDHFSFCISLPLSSSCPPWIFLFPTRVFLWGRRTSLLLRAKLNCVTMLNDWRIKFLIRFRYFYCVIFSLSSWILQLIEIYPNIKRSIFPFLLIFLDEFVWEFSKIMITLDYATN